MGASSRFFGKTCCHLGEEGSAPFEVSSLRLRPALTRGKMLESGKGGGG